MAATLEQSLERGQLTLRLGREHGNAINAALVEELASACLTAGSSDEVRGVLLAARGSLFSPGLDLQELIELDRPALGHFIERFSHCVLALYELPKPLVAAIHGHAVAGGCVLALTADWRVLRRGAQIGLNEIRVGLPLPFGVAMILRESVPKAHLEEVALFGRNYRDEEAVAAGLAHELHDAQGFEEHCRQRLDELSAKDRRAFAITKRYLRSTAVERIRAEEAAMRDEFVEAWFAPDAQRRMRDLVRSLRERRSAQPKSESS